MWTMWSHLPRQSGWFLCMQESVINFKSCHVANLLVHENSSMVCNCVSDIIFVTYITYYIYGEKLPCGEFSAFRVWRLQWNQDFLYMWRNFRCLPMTDVEKSEILHIWHVCDVENVAIYAKFMPFSWKISFVKIYALCREIHFYRNLRTFAWRKIYPKIFFMEKKLQIWGLSRS